MDKGGKPPILGISPPHSFRSFFLQNLPKPRLNTDPAGFGKERWSKRKELESRTVWGVLALPQDPPDLQNIFDWVPKPAVGALSHPLFSWGRLPSHGRQGARAPHARASQEPALLGRLHRPPRGGGGRFFAGRVWLLVMVAPWLGGIFVGHRAEKKENTHVGGGGSTVYKLVTLGPPARRPCSPLLFFLGGGFGTLLR